MISKTGLTPPIADPTACIRSPDNAMPFAPHRPTSRPSGAAASAPTSAKADNSQDALASPTPRSSCKAVMTTGTLPTWNADTMPAPTITGTTKRPIATVCCRSPIMFIMHFGL